MKKFLIVSLMVLASIFASAVPNGCYDGKFMGSSVKCGIHVSGNDISVSNRKGEVLSHWTIISEDGDGNFTAKSEFGATQTGKWWSEDGEIYLYFNYQTWTHD